MTTGSLKINVPTPLRPYAGGNAAVEVSGKNVSDALVSLTQQYPELKKQLFTDDGKLRAFVNVYVNDEDIRYLEKENTQLQAGDSISIVPSIAGGAGSEAQQFPYVTLLNVLHQPLERIDEKAISDACPHKWYNQTLCQVNDSVVRLGVVQGEYHWHKHDGDDEFFYVVEGRLLIDLEASTVELAPRQGVVIPKGVMHRPRAPERTVILMVETKGIIPTGN